MLTRYFIEYLEVIMDDYRVMDLFVLKVDVDDIKILRTDRQIADVALRGPTGFLNFNMYQWACVVLSFVIGFLNFNIYQWACVVLSFVIGS